MLEVFLNFERIGEDLDTEDLLVVEQVIVAVVLFYPDGLPELVFDGRLFLSSQMKKG